MRKGWLDPFCEFAPGGAVSGEPWLATSSWQEEPESWDLFACSRGRSLGLGLDVLPFLPDAQPFSPIGDVSSVQRYGLANED